MSESGSCTVQTAIARLKRAVLRSAGFRAMTNGLWPAGKPVVVREGVLRGTEMLVPPFSGCRQYALGHYEEVETGIVRKLAEVVLLRTFCDVGAHIGYYSVLVDRLTNGNCRTYAFEPSPASFACLAYNLAHSCTGEFRIYCEAVGDAIGTAEFLGPSGQVASGLAEYRPSHYGQAPATRLVHVTTLDETICSSDAPGEVLVKVDVEGAEAAVLKGAGKLVQSSRPFWLIECHTPDLKREVAQILTGWGYSCYELRADDSPHARLFAMHADIAARNAELAQWAASSHALEPVSPT